MPKINEEVEFELDLDKPSMYKVILHNDDYTTMEFVVMILTNIFHKSTEESEKIMWNIHEKGKGVCGVYTYEIAQTKVEQVLELAKDNEFPLLATMEEE
ncbi:ATP-dependent Clp protease adaptor protein ClpS [hydrothermal vent metagenome]|uniref:ATP-dependent Clp protease adaptor protein ClpS n=1 Tax=hydrothermal vent metagenome TaxID=652676 RepID=A0A1W1EH82_9ZZZZ